MQIYTQNGNWPNDAYFKKWEIYNAKTEYPNNKPILNELLKLHSSNISNNLLKENKTVFNEINICRKMDLTHIYAKVSLKSGELNKEDVAKREAYLGKCNTILSIGFDNIPKNREKMVGGIDMKEFEDHVIVLRKNDDAMSVTGFEYLIKDYPTLYSNIIKGIETTQEIYKTAYIVAQLYKRVIMDVFGNISYQEY